MIEEPNCYDVNAEINALLDITDNNYAKAVFIVCNAIERADQTTAKTY